MDRRLRRLSESREISRKIKSKSAKSSVSKVTALEEEIEGWKKGAEQRIATNNLLESQLTQLKSDNAKLREGLRDIKWGHSLSVNTQDKIGTLLEQTKEK